MNNIDSLEQKSKRGDLDAYLNLGQNKLDLVSRFIEKNLKFQI